MKIIKTWNTGSLRKYASINSINFRKDQIVILCFLTVLANLLWHSTSFFALKMSIFNASYRIILNRILHISTKSQSNTVSSKAVPIKSWSISASFYFRKFIDIKIIHVWYFKHLHEQSLYPHPIWNISCHNKCEYHCITVVNAITLPNGSTLKKQNWAKFMIYIHPHTLLYILIILMI